MSRMLWSCLRSRMRSPYIQSTCSHCPSPRVAAVSSWLRPAPITPGAPAGAARHNAERPPGTPALPTPLRGPAPRPTRSVRTRAFLAIREDLRRGEGLVARTERTPRGRGPLATGPHEHPAAAGRIFSQIAHDWLTIENAPRVVKECSGRG